MSINYLKLRCKNTIHIKKYQFVREDQYQSSLSEKLEDWIKHHNIMRTQMDVVSKPFLLIHDSLCKKSRF